MENFIFPYKEIEVGNSREQLPRGYGVMPVTFKIEGRVIRTVFSDPFTFDDFTRASLAGMKSRAFKPPMWSLIDVRQVNRSVPTAEIESIVQFSASHKHLYPRRGAIVCRTGTLIYGLARMFCAMAEGEMLQFEIFKSQKEAVAWLSLDNDPPED